jgi:hypothetical protein
MKKVDIVYTWVTFDSGLIKDLEAYYGERYIPANYQDKNELLYSLRSVNQYANWCRKIYLFTRDGQIPPWLNVKHSKIRIVHHSQVIPKQYLPALNSLVIESFIHKIPDLSEYFLYFNDDMILLQKTSVLDFYDLFGKPYLSQDSPIKKESIIQRKNKSFLESELEAQPFSFEKMCQFNDSLLDIMFQTEERTKSKHLPAPCRKSFEHQLDSLIQVYKMSSTGWSISHVTNMSKMRSNTSVARNSVFRKYFYKYQYNCYERDNQVLFLEINHLRSIRDKIEEIKNTKTKFMCVQNNIAYGDKNANIGHQDFDVLYKILEEKLVSSPFEI